MITPHQYFTGNIYVIAVKTLIIHGQFFPNAPSAVQHSVVCACGEFVFGIIPQLLICCKA